MIFYRIFIANLKAFDITDLFDGTMKLFDAPMCAMELFKINFC